LNLKDVREMVVAISGSGIVPPESVGAGRFQKLIQRVFSKTSEDTFGKPPKISSQSCPAGLVAVDIGNSQIKLGQFARGKSSLAPNSIQEPNAAIELPILHKAGVFELKRLAEWGEQHLSSDAHFLVGSVHRGAANLLYQAIDKWADRLGINWT